MFEQLDWTKPKCWDTGVLHCVNEGIAVGKDWVREKGANGWQTCVEYAQKGSTHAQHYYNEYAPIVSSALSTYATALVTNPWQHGGATAAGALFTLGVGSLLTANRRVMVKAGGLTGVAAIAAKYVLDNTPEKEQLTLLPPVLAGALGAALYVRSQYKKNQANAAKTEADNANGEMTQWMNGVHSKYKTEPVDATISPFDAKFNRLRNVLNELAQSVYGYEKTNVKSGWFKGYTKLGLEAQFEAKLAEEKANSGLALRDLEARMRQEFDSKVTAAVATALKQQQPSASVDTANAKGLSARIDQLESWKTTNSKACIEAISKVEGCARDIGALRVSLLEAQSQLHRDFKAEFSGKLENIEGSVKDLKATLGQLRREITAVSGKEAETARGLKEQTEALAALERRLGDLQGLVDACQKKADVVNYQPAITTITRQYEAFVKAQGEKDAAVDIRLTKLLNLDSQIKALEERLSAVIETAKADLGAAFAKADAEAAVTFNEQLMAAVTATDRKFNAAAADTAAKLAQVQEKTSSQVVSLVGSISQGVEALNMRFTTVSDKADQAAAAVAGAQSTAVDAKRQLDDMKPQVDGLEEGLRATAAQVDVKGISDRVAALDAKVKAVEAALKSPFKPAGGAAASRRS